MVPYVIYVVRDRFAFHQEKRKEIDEARELGKEEEKNKAMTEIAKN